MSPHEMGRHIVLGPLSVCPSVCTWRFRVRSISFEPLAGFINHFAQMSSMMRRWAVPMFIKVVSRLRSRSQSKIKHCMTLFRVRSISFEPLVGFTNYFAQMSPMIGRCAVPNVWPRSVQGQGHNLRLNIVWLYFVSALYLMNPCWVLQIVLHKCQVWWDDMQCLCLTKVGSRSRSQSKIKHCMTVFRVRSISFETLVGLPIILHKCQVWWDDVQCLCLTKVGSRSRSQSKIKHCMTVFRVRSISYEHLLGFTNYFAQMSSMMRRYAVLMFDQGRFKVKVTI